MNSNFEKGWKFLRALCDPNYEKGYTVYDNEDFPNMELICYDNLKRKPLLCDTEKKCSRMVHVPKELEEMKIRYINEFYSSEAVSKRYA